jgi:methionyl aminopeptidase
MESNLEKYIKAGEIHRKVREYVRPHLTSGIKYVNIVKIIENKIAEEISNLNKCNEPQINNGIAFPTGISVNNVAAHFTPSYKDDSVLKSSDVMKIDYGVHIDGCIIDSAFTINLNDKYSEILKASREAVNAIIKNMGVDSRFYDLSAISQEIVESYEHEGKTLKVIDNLSGHNILPWKIHGGKMLYGKPQHNSDYDDLKVDDGEVMAIEIFVSNGNGTTQLGMNPLNYSHYMLKPEIERIPLFTTKKTNEVSRIITKNFKTLPFCPRFIDNINKNHTNYIANLQDLFGRGYLNSYPPLMETDKNSKVAQFEHSVFIGENKKIVLSK